MITCHYNDTTISFEADYEDNFIKVEQLQKYQFNLIPKKTIHLYSFEANVKLNHSPNAYYYMNGFQSWTPTLACTKDTRLHSLDHVPSFLDRKYAFSSYGDYRFINYGKEKGIVHGWSYCCIEENGKKDIYASKNERSGYTAFIININTQELKIKKDLDIDVDKEIEVLNVIECNSYDEVFPSNPQKKLWGYTSWYEHYQNINETVLLNNLDALSNSKYSYDVFQIDDGFETYVGDWLDIDSKKFPNGLKPLTKQIHAKGMKAGIWLAPFLCEKESKVFKEHQDWLLKDNNGQVVKSGHNWSHSYALDFYNKDVQAYIKKFLSAYVDFGFDFFKLDFLYAIALLPRENKTRGQIMAEATDFLRECLPNQIILGCGVPLCAAAYKFEYCRTGADIGPDYDNNAFMRLFHNERVSTKNDILNTLYRYPLNERFFGNDPDVYLFNKDIKLTKQQKQALFIINVLFGRVIFTSDQIDRYDNEELDLLEFGRKLDPKHLEVHPKDNGMIDLVVDSFTLRFDSEKGVLLNLEEFQNSFTK